MKRSKGISVWMGWTTFAVLSLQTSAARTDDGYFGTAGNPFPYGKAPAITLCSEVVSIRYKAGQSAPMSQVEVKFHFYNPGSAKTVEVGFPEYGDTSDDGQRNHTIEGFRSWVGGKRARVACVWSDSLGAYVYKKEVRFVPRGFTNIMVSYTQAPAFQNDIADKAAYGIPYVFSTGGTWSGSIGKALILITAVGGRQPTAITSDELNNKVIPAAALKKYREADDDRARATYVAYFRNHKGPTAWVDWDGGRAVQKGNTIRIWRTHFKPKAGSDLWFGTGVKQSLTN